jgi:alkylated DNA repair dioxygenase AlkB
MREQNVNRVKKIILPNTNIQLYSDFVDKKDCFALLEKEVDWLEKEIILFGKKIMQPRLVSFYGDQNVSYKYSGQTINALPWISLLRGLKEKVELASNTSFNSCLLNYYRDGNDSMGWHQDNEKELGENPIIASVSFGGQRVFKLKHIDLEIKKDIVLTNGSLLIMAGSTQHFYKHAILKTKKSVLPRINLTFRQIN